MDNNQQNSQYNIVPFQKVVIDLTNIDRSLGQYFPQYEGDGLIVEACDYPVLCSFVNLQTGIQSTMWLIPGASMRCPFKGLYITHPLLTYQAGASGKLSFVVDKNCAVKENTLANPYPAFYPPYSIIGDTALAGTFDIYIPTGTRYINRLECFFTATTVTQAQWNINEGVSPNGTQESGPVIAGYAAQSICEGFFVPSILGTRGFIVAQDIPIPFNSGFIRVATTGTAMVLTASLRLKATFQ